MESLSTESEIQAHELSPACVVDVLTVLQLPNPLEQRPLR
jgi:hypothetical protein